MLFPIYKVGGKYRVIAIEKFEHPESYPGNYTGWMFKDEEKARKFAYIISQIKDPLAVKYLLDLMIFD